MEVAARQGFFCQRGESAALEESRRFQAARGVSDKQVLEEGFSRFFQLNEKHKLFKPGQTVVDLVCPIVMETRHLLIVLTGLCTRILVPGTQSSTQTPHLSFSLPMQVAVNRTSPGGRVVGIDLIPAQPPRGVSTIQGNFLSPTIQAEVRAYVQDPDLGRPRREISSHKESGMTEEELDEMERGYVDIERQAHLEGVEVDSAAHTSQGGNEGANSKLSTKERDKQQGRVVDVVLSDMSEPWDQTTGFYKKSLSDPYFRLMNTSGIAFKDHAGSMVSPLEPLSVASSQHIC